MRVTKYGGNNYRYFFCLAGRWDPANPGKVICYGPEGASRAKTPNIPTVWRKYWTRVNAMADRPDGWYEQCLLDLPAEQFGDFAHNEIKGALDDGFIEIDLYNPTHRRF